MPSSMSNFLDKVLGRIGRLDARGLQTVIQRLARERSFLETLFNAIEDGVLVVDEHGQILYYNRAVTNLIGLPAQGAEGQPIQRLLPELDWRKLASLDRTGGAHLARRELEVTYPRPRFLSLYVAPLDGEATGSSGLALIIHDVTEARQKTFEAIESERVQALTLLAASVAHEIGNPLNALSIHLQLIERELRKLHPAPAEPGGGKKGSVRSDKKPPPPALPGAPEVAPKLEKYLVVCKGEMARLDYIITQFLQAIRPSPPQRQPVALNDVVLDTLQVLMPEIENRGLILKKKLGAHLPAVPIDPAQIKQALLNLIKNAIQAMSKGGTLTLQTDTAPEGVYLTVADTGGGIAPDRMQRLFEPFYTTKKKGTGLGLMIVQRIIREHQGRIGLESHVGKGTAFRLWLPLHERRVRLLKEGAVQAGSGG